MGVYLTAISVVFLIPMLSLDDKRKRQEKAIRNEKTEQLRQQLIDNGEEYDHIGNEVEEKEDAFKFSDLKRFTKLFWLNTMSGIIQISVIIGY